MQQPQHRPVGDLLREPLPCPHGGVSHIQAAPELEEIPGLLQCSKLACASVVPLAPRWGPVSYQTGPDQGDSSPKQNNSGTRLHGQSESKCEENSGGILKQFRNPQQGFRIGSSTEDLKGIMACGCEGLPEPCRTQLFGPTAPVYGSYTNKQKLSKPGQSEPLLAHHRFA